jgi:hypothetical protein
LLIKEIKDMAKATPEKAIETLLKLVETNLPVQKIYVHEADDEEIQKDTSSDIDINLLIKLMRKLFDDLRSAGYSEQQAKNVLRITEPFDNYEPLIDEL